MKPVSVWKQNILYKLVKKYLLRLIAASLVIACIGVGISAILKQNTYESTSQLAQKDNNYNLINSYGQYLTFANYKNILRSEIQDSKWKNYENKEDYSVSISTGTSSPFFSIKIISDNPNYSIFLVNKTADIFTKNVGRYLSGANVSVVSHSKKASRVSIKRELAIIGGLIFIVVLVLMTVVVFYAELYSGKVKDEGFAQDILGIKKIGVINMGQSQEG